MATSGEEPVAIPPEVVAASRAFGSELRLELLRFFERNPGSRQAEAVRTIGAERAVVSLNVRALKDLGLLEQAADRTYRVDAARRRALITALRAHLGDR